MDYVVSASQPVSLRFRVAAAALLSLAPMACRNGGHSIDPPNAAIAAEVNEAASNIGATDGREATTVPMTPAESGATMRASAAERPRGQ